MAHAPHSNDPHGHDSHGHDKVGHLVSPKILVATAAALLALTGITVASVKIDFAQMDLPELNIAVALTIAVIKASLVCLFFMHLRWDRPFNSFVLVASIAAVALFIGFSMTDTAENQPDIIQTEHQTIQTKVAATLEQGAQEPAPAHGDGTAGAAAH
jgi:cytochrome c oxidase subunit IV